MDVLSDTLRVVRLAGAVFFTANVTGPWAVASPPPVDIARVLRLRSDCIALFHVLTEGGCWVVLDDERPLWMEVGDVAIFPHGSTHIIGSALERTPIPLSAILPMQSGEEIRAIEVGGPGPATRLVCGYLSCDERFNPLIGALPSLLLVHIGPAPEQTERRGLPVEGPSATSHRLFIQEGDWLAVTLRQIIAEASGQDPGCSAMLARLTEVVYVEVLRRYMQCLPAERGGWLAGVRDPVVGEALRLLHAHPERPWTVDELARTIAVSRSTLAQRFSDLTGDSPMRYLAQWRIHLAKQLLRQTTLGMREIAPRVGYESEVAFNRAFHRHVGQPPASWRLSSGDVQV